MKRCVSDAFFTSMLSAGSSAISSAWNVVVYGAECDTCVFMIIPVFYGTVIL